METIEGIREKYKKLLRRAKIKDHAQLIIQSNIEEIRFFENKLISKIQHYNRALDRGDVERARALEKTINAWTIQLSKDHIYKSRPLRYDKTQA